MYWTSERRRLCLANIEDNTDKRLDTTILDCICRYHADFTSWLDTPGVSWSLLRTQSHLSDFLLSLIAMMTLYDNVPLPLACFERLEIA